MATKKLTPAHEKLMQEYANKSLYPSKKGLQRDWDEVWMPLLKKSMTVYEYQPHGYRVAMQGKTVSYFPQKGKVQQHANNSWHVIDPTSNVAEQLSELILNQ